MTVIVRHADPSFAEMNEEGNPRMIGVYSNYNDLHALEATPRRLLGTGDNVNPSNIDEQKGVAQEVEVIAPLEYVSDELRLQQTFQDRLAALENSTSVAVEATARTNADAAEVTARTNAVSAEATTRANAVTTLSGRITPFETRIPTTIPGSFTTDALAQAGGVAVGSFYHNAGALRVRLT